MHTYKSVKEYELACRDVLRDFAEKYYDYEPLDVDDCWVGNEVGGVAGINGEFYDIDFMVKALKLNLSSDDMFKYHYYNVDTHSNGNSPLKLEAWLKLERR